MARANRHYIPGRLRHLTHRCHSKEFLLKFGRGWQWAVDRINRSPKNFSQGKTGLFKRVGNFEGLRQGD